jgi:hypothetical protein
MLSVFVILLFVLMKGRVEIIPWQATTSAYIFNFLKQVRTAWPTRELKMEEQHQR